MLAALDKPDLTVPRLRAEPERMVEVRPRRIRSWLEELPLSDAAAAAGRLYQALYALNRVPLNPENRLELLGVYRDLAVSLSEALRSAFVSLPMPLNGRARRMAELRRGLELEMATGYKRVVHDTLAGSRKGARHRHLAGALGLTLEHLGRLLRGCYEVYVPCPAGTWRELHQTYGYADFHGLATQAPEAGDSLATYYVRVLLLGLCNPYGLLQGDCERVWRYLQSRPLRAAILADPAGLDAEGRFLISINADSPPIPLPRTDLDASGYLRVLDAVPVVRDVRELCEQIEAGTPPASITQFTEFVDDGYLDLLKRMARSWGTVIKRQANRSARADTVSVCIGLNPAHYFLSGEQPFVRSPNADAAAAAAYDVDLDDLAAADAGDPVTDAATTDGEVFATDTWRNVGSYQVFRWHTKDEGAGGMALRYREDDPVRVRVGDVLLVRDGDTAQWCAAAVRWMKCALTAAFLEIGIQRLAPGVRAAAVRPLPRGDGDTPGEYVQALLLPASTQIRQPASLIVPRGLNLSQRRLQLRDGDAQPVTVDTVSVLDRTGAYERLAYTELRDTGDAGRG